MKQYQQQLNDACKNILYPNKKHYVDHSKDMVLRRGAKSKCWFYGTAVHQDYATTPEDMAETQNAYDTTGRCGDEWLEEYNQEENKGFTLICFWRPIHQTEPCIHLPLSVCDPQTVKKEDIVKSKLLGFAPRGDQPQYCLKNSADHEWYFYPDMTNDEVLAMKQYYNRKDWPEDEPYKGVFHTAFEDPRQKKWFKEENERASSEYRIFVWHKE